MGLIIARLNTLPTDVTNISVGSRIILPNGKEYILNNLKVWIPIHMMALEVKEDLINEDLNTIDKFGIYHQNSNNNALISKNYPVQSAGVLKVYVNNGNVFQEYQILTGQYNENQIYTRGKYAGYWSNWLKPNYVNINESDYNSLLSNKHNHSNKELLDSYTQTNENLLDAVNKKHLHSNINELNSINSTKINNWDIAYSWGNHNSFNYLTQTSGDIRYLKNTGYNDYDGSIRIVDTENEDTSYFVSGLSNAYITNNTINLSGFGLYSNLMNNLINNYWFGITEYVPMVPPNEIKFFEYDKTINRLTFGVDLPIYLNTLNLGTINQNKILTLDNAGKIGYIDGIPVLKSDLLNNNIGIGTSTPTYKLHVNSGNSNGIRIDTDIDKTALSISGTGKVEVDAPTIKGGRLTILDNGNVGIGTTSPSEKLEVGGNVKATGFKTSSGTSNQALTANGGVFDLNTKADLEVVNNLQIGGRNLLLNTSSDWTLFSGTGYGVKVFNKTVAKVGETFTVKVFVRNSNSPTPIKLEIHELNSDNQRVEYYSKQVINGVVEKTITTKSTNIAFLEVNLYFGDYYGTTTYQYEYSKPKLERGNKATDWTPAPEDIQTALDNKLDKGTYTGTAQNLKNDIDNIQVSFTNLILNSKNILLHPNDNGTGASVLHNNESDKYYRATPDSDKKVSLYSSYISTNVGDTYIMGIYVRHGASTNQTIRLFDLNSTSVSNNYTVVPPNVWTFIKTKSYISENSTSLLILINTSNDANGLYLDYKKAITLQGNRLLDWTLAPEDKQDNLQTIVGNVGIGTKSPTLKFEVDNTTTGEQCSLGIVADNVANVTNLSSKWYNTINNSIKFHRGGNSTGGEISIWTTPANGLLTERIRITSEGNVGMNTNSPSEKLDVNGYVKASGFKKTGGTASQFLMADGSIIEKSTIGDNQTLSTSIDNNGRYLSISGGNQISIDSRLIHVLDSPNRNPNDPIFYPNVTGKSVRFDFISSGHISGTSGAYAGLMTFSPWDGTTNSTGDSSYQLAFYNQTGVNGSGIPGLKIRKGIDTTWNNWYKIYTDGDFSQSNINNWNTAHGWGNHASAGYALATGTNATNNWSNTSSGLSINPTVTGKTLNASGQTVTLRDATYGQISGIVQEATNGPIVNDWYNKLKTLHNNSQGYFTELSQSFTGTEGVWHRRCAGGNISSWKQLYDDSIWNAASISYSGNTLTLTINGISKTTTIYNAGTNITLSGNTISVNSSPIFSGNVTANSFTFLSDNIKTLPAIVGKFKTQTGGSNDFELIFDRSAVGTGAYYSIQSIEQGIAYNNLILQPHGGNVGIGTTSPSEKLEVTGNIKATSFFETSLRKYKTNIKKFDKSGIDLVDSLEIVTFDRIDSDVKSKIGIIADDSPEEFLSENKDAVDLYKTIFIQSKAIQELNAKNLELEERLIKLEKLLSNG